MTRRLPLQLPPGLLPEYASGRARTGAGTVGDERPFEHSVASAGNLKAATRPLTSALDGRETADP